MRFSPIYLLFLALLWNAPLYAQKMKKYPLSEKLFEISGLEFLNDSTLVALNDGGDKSKLYVLNLNGELLKTVEVDHAKNRDWEDLTVDDKYLYIGDVGNNLNTRKKLVIYRVKIKDVLDHKEVEAKKISFTYADQEAYPPSEDSLFYDAEAIAMFNGELLLFTKNRSKPSSGTTRIYKVPTKPGKYQLKLFQEIEVGKRGFWKDAITAADIVGDQLYLMTYNRILIKSWKNGKFQGDEVIKFSRLTQKESIVISPKGCIFIADEKRRFLGGGNLYRFKR